MDFNIDFNLVRSQKLLLIPQLKQAIEILEMNSRDLFNYVEGQMETNPVLEEAVDNKAPAYPAYASGMQDNIDEDAEMQTEDIAGSVLSLKEHLLIQLETVSVDKCSYMIGEYLIDNTDDNGYLKVDISEVASHLQVTGDMVMAVLAQLQSFDPPGICARDLKECLLLQLRQMDETDEEAILIVDKHLDALACNDIDSVSLATGIPAERVGRLFDKVRELEPRPGREYFEKEAESPVIPDIIIEELNDSLQVMYNEEAFPDICISESCALNAAASGGSIDRDSLQDKLSSAVWLIKCLEQREDIIFTIAQKLCEYEKMFFKKGEKALKLLDKEAFSSSLCMHESILEKAVTGKYLQCRWGIYELRSFFVN